MKTYLVGGAVRDQLLGLPVTERDWVVVGATPEKLYSQGYQAVGRDFPVFLHPQTHEEYALARTERKSAPGYYGFTCDYNKHVTLVDDLARRDLTINAMAMDPNGNLIDPYHGSADLQAKKLRHVSQAFVEDPVRVLRVARFAARYYYLGFTIAEETRALMYSMMRQGELAHLVPERIWQEWMRSLQEKNPEIFIYTLRDCGALQVIFPELDALFGVPNPPQYHPEVDSGVHSLLSLAAAVRLSDDSRVRFAALLHDLGKAKTPITEWPAHHGHEKSGVQIIVSLCKRLRIPADYRKLAVLSVTMHLNIHRVLSLRASTMVSILEETDALRRPERFLQLLLVCEADACGTMSKQVDYPQADMWRAILRVCQNVSVSELIARGVTGKDIQRELHQLRVDAVKRLCSGNKLSY